MGEAKLQKTRLVSTSGLQPGDRIMGCEHWSVMVPQEGYLVEGIIKSCGVPGCNCTIICFKGGSKEGFNPLWGWYVIREDEPEQVKTYILGTFDPEETK